MKSNIIPTRYLLCVIDKCAMAFFIFESLKFCIEIIISIALYCITKVIVLFSLTSLGGLLPSDSALPQSRELNNNRLRVNTL